MPPATLGTVLGPDAPASMAKPHWKPDSSVVGPTSLLNENVPPGGTTVPLIFSAASLMLAFFSGIDPANDVLPRSISSRMLSALGSSDETAGGVIDTGSATVRVPLVRAARNRPLVAVSSKSRPAELGRRTFR